MPPSWGELPEDLQTCGFNITPACIRALYDIPRNYVNLPENTLGVFESIGDAYSQKDLNMFFAQFAPYVPQGKSYRTDPRLARRDAATTAIGLAI